MSRLPICWNYFLSITSKWMKDHYDVKWCSWKWTTAKKKPWISERPSVLSTDLFIDYYYYFIHMCNWVYEGPDLIFMAVKEKQHHKSQCVTWLCPHTLCIVMNAMYNRANTAVYHKYSLSWIDCQCWYTDEHKCDCRHIIPLIH